MKIHKIKIEKFKSIYDPLEIDFQQVKGFWQISGPVGSGKTTIGEAIIYGLFGKVGGKNNPDLVSWNQKHGKVEIWCESKGNELYIKRELNVYGQSPVYVEVNGEELVFTNKRDAQSQLEQEYFDVSKTILESMCIISFNNFKSLATLNTGDTKKFLDQVLGFYMLNNYTEKCKELMTKNSYDMNKLSIDIEVLRNQIKKLEELSNIEIINENKDEVKKKMNELDKQCKEITSSYKKIINDLTSDKDKLEQEKTSVMTLGSKLKKEIEFIQKGICPTCGAPIDKSHLEEKQEERKLLLNQYNDLLVKINDVCVRINKNTADASNETKKLIEEYKECEKLIIRLDEQAKRKSFNQKEINNINDEIEKHVSKLNIYKEEDLKWKELLDILSTQIRAQIMQSFIPTLNENINKYSQRLRLPYIIEFDSSFKCSITLQGSDKTIPLSALSTGQLKTTDMVIILGILGTLLGANKVNVLFLDELFSNLDADLRGEMCSVLREFLEEDMSIFIISHSELDDKYFDGEIKMELHNFSTQEKHSKINVIYN